MNATPTTAASDAEDDIERILERRAKLERRAACRKGCEPKAARPMMSATNEERTTTPNDSRLEIAQNQLEGEEDAGDRGVERRRDAAGGAAGDEDAQPRLGHARQLAEGRAERRADLHDRALAADRSARADAERRGERLDDGNLRTDAASALGDGEHHLRNAVPARLAGEEVDRAARRAARRRRARAPRTRSRARGSSRYGGMAGSAVVAVAGEYLGEAENQISKRDRARTRARPDGERERDHARRSRAQPVAKRTRRVPMHRTQSRSSFLPRVSRKER